MEIRLTPAKGPSPQLAWFCRHSWVLPCLPLCLYPLRPVRWHPEAQPSSPKLWKSPRRWCNGVLGRWFVNIYEITCPYHSNIPPINSEVRSRRVRSWEGLFVLDSEKETAWNWTKSVGRMLSRARDNNQEFSKIIESSSSPLGLYLYLYLHLYLYL